MKQFFIIILKEIEIVDNGGIGLEILKVRGLGLEESAGFPIFITIAVLLTLTSVFTLRKRKKII